MNTSNDIQYAASFVLAVLPWLFPGCAWYWKVIITLCILLLTLSIYCLRLMKKLKYSENEKKDIQDRHQALALQFDQKVEDIKQYRKVFSDLRLLLHLALQNTKQAKLEDIYRAFIIAQQELNDGGNNDAL